MATTNTHFTGGFVLIHRFLLAVLVLAVASFGAPGSGIFFDIHVSRGMMQGDKLGNLEGTVIGSVIGDSVHYIANEKEGTAKSNYSPLSSYPVDFQYAVQYSFLAGYEKSLSKVLSVRAALGYQKALLEAYGATIPGYQQGDQTEVPFVSAKIDRHWLTLPIDFKATLPIKRSGLYLAVGPKTSVLLSSQYTDSITGYTADLGDLTPRFNLGLGFRAGVEIPIATAGFLLIESGYHHGLVKTSPISAASTREGELALLGVGFRMNL